MEKEWFWFSWKELAGVLFFDVGKVGDENIFVSHEKYRTSTGCGLVLKLSARDYPFQIGAILAQALETERKPILYLNFSTPMVKKYM